MKTKITEPDSLGLSYAITGDHIDIHSYSKPYQETISPLEKRCKKAAKIINGCPLLQPHIPGYYPRRFFNAKIDRDLCVVNITMPGWSDTEFYIAPSEATEEQIDGSEVKTPAWKLYIDDDLISSTMTLATVLSYLYEWDARQAIEGELRNLYETPNV